MNQLLADVSRFEPTSWFGLAAIALGGLVTVATSTIAAWATLRSRRDTSALTEQITNGHKTIFRDDFDALVRAMQELREDLHGERAERRQDVKELRQDLHHRFSDLNSRLNSRLNNPEGSP